MWGPTKHTHRPRSDRLFASSGSHFTHLATVSDAPSPVGGVLSAGRAGGRAAHSDAARWNLGSNEESPEGGQGGGGPLEEASGSPPRNLRGNQTAAAAAADETALEGHVAGRSQAVGDQSRGSRREGSPASAGLTPRPHARAPRWAAPLLLFCI